MSRERESCPVCGTPLGGAELVRAWPGKYAHKGCASYVRRPRSRLRRHSQGVYRKFTRR